MQTILEALRGGIYLLTARDRDGPRAMTVAVLVTDDGEAEAEIDLRTGPHVLAGRVRHADGRPFVGWVYLQAPIEGPVASFALALPNRTVPRRLAPDGTFRFEGLQKGRVGLVAVDPGVRLLRRGKIPVPSDAPLDLVIDHGTTRRYRVVDAGTGQGLPDVEIFQGSSRGGDTSFLGAVVRTDQDGVARLDAPAQGRLSVFCSADGYAARQATVRADGEETVIRLDRLATVQGTVTDADGRPVEGVTVHALGLRRRSRGFPDAVSRPTNARGHYEIRDASPGDVMVFGRGGGWISPGLSEARAEGFNPFAHRLEAGRTIEVTVPVVPAASVEGRITDAQGQPIPGARVTVQPAGPSGGPGGVPGTEGLLPRFTDAHGRFVVDTVPPGAPRRVVAWAGGGARSAGRSIESDPFTLRAGERRTVDLTVPLAEYVTVLVEDEDGEPVAGARIEVVRTDERGRQIRMRAARWPRTDAGGTLRTDALPPGPTALLVKADGHLEAGPTPIPDGARRGDEPLVVVLRRGLTVAGKVVVPEGLDPRRVALSLERRDGTARNGRRHPRVGEDGSFPEEGLEPGDWRLTASASWEGTHWQARL
ncbi:MAG: collagen binding domain-containing protein, partial [Planctomycetota bacterium]